MGYSLSTTSPFLKGLNTELNKLVDSTEYTSDELNCMIRQNNTRSRRPGLDYEELYKFNNEYLDLSKPSLAFQCIEWTDINSPDEAETYTGYPYLVCQVGGKIIFFRNEGQPYSGHQEEYVLDLASYRLDVTSDAYISERCKFTAAYGCIFITSKAIKPIYLRSAQEPNDPIAPSPTVPAGSLSVSVPNSKLGRWAGWGWAEFYINGTSIGKCTIQQYNSGANGNCKHGPWMLCSTQLANFWNSLPSTSNQGITATPKYTDGRPVQWGINSVISGNNTAGGGAYISDYITFTAPAGSGTTFRGTKISVHMEGLWQVRSSSGTGTLDYSCTLAGGTNYVYKNNLNLTIRDTNVGANDFLAVDDNPTKMSYAHLYNLLNQGWTPKLIAKYYAAQNPNVFPGNNLAQQFLKDDKTSAFKPANAINMTFGNTPAARGHEILEFFDQKRVTKSNLVQVFTQLVSELNTATSTTRTFNDYVDTSFVLTDPTQANVTDALSQVPNVKPRKPYVNDICAYAGRIFYLSGDVLLYSQIIAEDISKADMCYTDADPTGEEISDVIESDGGMISLPEIGEGIKLQPCGDSLLVFGTRGNQLISGTVNNIFTATAYNASAINAVPTQAPDSFVSTEYGVFYWGTTGIQFIAPTEQGMQTKDLSTDKILTFFGKINNTQHQYCKGVYSSSKKKVYWFYPSNESLPRRLDLCLVYDIQRDAFAPQKIVSQDDFKGESSTVTPEVVSGTQLKVPFKSVKEYPLYAEAIVPDDTDTYQYTQAVPTDGGSITVPNYTHTLATGIDSNYAWTANDASINSDRLMCNTNLSLTTPGTTCDIVVCCDIDGGVPTKGTPMSHGEYHVIGMNSTYAVQFPNNYRMMMFARYFPTAVPSYDGQITAYHWTFMAQGSRGASNVRKYVTNVDLSSCRLWLRYKYTCNADGTNPVLTAYYYADTTKTTTASTLPPLTSWTTILASTDNAELPYIGFSTTPNRLMMTALQSIDGKVLLKNCKDLDGHFSCVHESAIPTLYYNSTAATAHAYYDSALSVDAGLLSNFYNDGHKYVKTQYRTLLRQAKGSNKTLVAKPWTGVDGLHDIAYMTPANSASYLNNTQTTAEDDKLFSNIDATDYFYQNGRIHYDSVPLTQATALDSEITNWTITYSGIQTGNQEIVDDSGYKVLADEPLDSEEFTYESSILLCLDPANCKVTFGDFRNNYMRDWAEGDLEGDGYTFESYMIGHPVNSQDFVRQKSMPYLISYFKRSETGKTVDGSYLYGSKCQGSVRWDWRTDGLNSKWDRPNELYRPDKRTILSQGYIITKTNIRGLGRSFQVKVQGVDDNNFIVEAFGFNLQKDERI